MFSELGGGLHRDVPHVGHTRRVHDANHFAQPTEAFAAPGRLASGHPDDCRPHIVCVPGQHLRAAPRSPWIRVPAQFFW